MQVKQGWTSLAPLASPAPAVREKILPQGRESSYHPRQGVAHWWQKWEHPLMVCGPLRNVGSNLPSRGRLSNHGRSLQEQSQKGTGSPERGLGGRGGLLTAPAGAVLASTNRHSSSKSYAWTQDPAVLADVISKRSHAQTSLWYLNSNYCFPQN